MSGLVECRVASVASVALLGKLSVIQFKGQSPGCSQYGRVWIPTCEATLVLLVVMGSELQNT